MWKTLSRTYSSSSASKTAVAASKRLPPLPSIGDILRMYNIRAKKSLSQNFILDPRILNGIAKHSRVSDKYVVEVGPGPGGITRSLLQAGAKQVFVIEKDARFVPSLNLLKEASGGDRLQINIGDCLTYNVESMIPVEAKVPWDSLTEDSNVVLVGNLPFNVATPFFLRLLASMDDHTNYYSFGRVPAVLTFQHEVALRMCAPPGDPQRCRLSAITQNYLEVDYLTTLPGGAFVPPPEVSVGLIKVVPHVTPYVRDLPFKLVNKVITGLFLSKKQKYLTSIKRHLVPAVLHDEVVPVLAEGLDIPEDRTPLAMTMEEISRVCYAYAALCRLVQDSEDHKADMFNFHGKKFRSLKTEEKEKLVEFKRGQKAQFKETMFDIQLL